jgi:hypothetical protein
VLRLAEQARDQVTAFVTAEEAVSLPDELTNTQYADEGRYRRS